MPRYENKGKAEIALPQDSRVLRFNVSNSGGLALIAVASGSAIGVDIEKVRPKADFLHFQGFSRYRSVLTRPVLRARWVPLTGPTQGTPLRAQAQGQARRRRRTKEL